jgi:hypothetical protein
VSDPGGPVDDQQDSFDYGHRKLFHFPIDSAFVLRVTLARSVAGILTIFDVCFSISSWTRNETSHSRHFASSPTRAYTNVPTWDRYILLSE